MTQEGEMKNICPWDITAGRELPSSPPPNPPSFTQLFWIKGKEKVAGAMQMPGSHLWQAEML